MFMELCLDTMLATVPLINRGALDRISGGAAVQGIDGAAAAGFVFVDFL